MKRIKALAFIALFSLSSLSVTAAVGDVIIDSNLLKYNILSEYSDGKGGTSEGNGITDAKSKLITVYLIAATELESISSARDLLPVERFSSDNPLYQ
ncbi:MAG: hypothetical protein J1E38_09390 [Paramuribaculum sp.]|nr:hypothetical protein [Paramuribaculum sp.]